MTFNQLVQMFRASPSDARLLPEGRMAGPMPWVIAIMMFLTVLAAAAGLSLSATASGLDADLSGRLTVQVVEADTTQRARFVRALSKELPKLAAVDTVSVVSDDDMNGLLRPWFGDAFSRDDLPVPALIDISLKRKNPGDLNAVRALVKSVSTASRVDEHSQWLAPLARLLGSLKWISITLVLLMAAAMAFTVVLVARAALNSHRETIEVMHLLGANDAQVAGLFQRRIALDALFGGSVGFLMALITLFLIRSRLLALGSDLATTYGPGWLGWLTIFLLPLFGVLLAMAAARYTVMLALKRML